MNYEKAPLEDWYRESYFTTSYDISGSGVEDYSFKEYRDNSEFKLSELDKILFHDSQTIGCELLRKSLREHLGVKESTGMT